MHSYREDHSSEEIQRLLVVGRNSSIAEDANFISAVESSGYAFVKNVDEQPHLVLCFDWHQQAEQVIRSAKQQGAHCSLIVQEPEVVLPSNWSTRVRKKFSRVLEVGNPHSNSLVPWPQNWPQSVPPAVIPRLNKAVMVQARKFSFVKGQFYSLRAQLASTDKRVDVFGPDWGNPDARLILRIIAEFLFALRASSGVDLETLGSVFSTPIRWHGPARDKISVMKDYKVAVTIENSGGYMSEKIFDAFFSGCIPVYVGPSLEPFEVPGDLYVRAQPNLESIKSALTYALEMDYNTWLGRVKAYLASPKTYEIWSSRSAFMKLIDRAHSF